MQIEITMALVTTFFLAFVRVSALFLFSPIFAVAQVPVRVQNLILLALSAMLVMGLDLATVNVPTSLFALLEASVHEFLVGSAMAFGLFAAFGAFLVGGRIIIVLSMLRHAFGMQQTPPNTVLISLALFLTIFNMLPSFSQLNERALQPYLQGHLETQEALDLGMLPLRDFMVKQPREEDLMLIIDIAEAERPNSVDDIHTFHLVPAFMLSELKSAFQIGFVIFLPFLLIDMIVASVLMSMVPPMMISLPIKVLMFVLIDGWNLVVHSLLNSFS